MRTKKKMLSRVGMLLLPASLSLCLAVTFGCGKNKDAALQSHADEESELNDITRDMFNLESTRQAENIETPAPYAYASEDDDLSGVEFTETKESDLPAEDEDLTSIEEIDPQEDMDTGIEDDPDTDPQDDMDTDLQDDMDTGIEDDPDTDPQDDMDTELQDDADTDLQDDMDTGLEFEKPDFDELKEAEEAFSYEE